MPKIPKIVSSVDASSLELLAQLLRDVLALPRPTRRASSVLIARMALKAESALVAERIAIEMCRLRKVPGYRRKRPGSRGVRLAAKSILDSAGDVVDPNSAAGR